MSNEYKICQWCKKKKRLGFFYDYDRGKFRKICSSCYNNMMMKKQKNKEQKYEMKNENETVQFVMERHTYDIQCPQCGHKHFRVDKANQIAGYDLALRCYMCNYVLYMDLAKFFKLTNKKTMGKDGVENTCLVN